MNSREVPAPERNQGSAVSDISYLQSTVIGALQGVTELFPISSLGHSVLVPAWIGGSWAHLATENSSSDAGGSPYLAFVVALHVATAAALLLFYRRDWVRIGGALVTSARTRSIRTSTERLAWLLVVATIPVGIIGLALEHTFRTVFAKPVAASVFLTVNGLILLGAERLRRRSEVAVAAREPEHVLAGVAAGAGADGAGADGGPEPARRRSTSSQPTTRSLENLSFREAGVIGFFQTFALLAGISRSGVSMAGGLLRGLDHEDAAKFSFLLATPVIAAAGALKLPTLAGASGAHIHGQILVGFVTAGVCAYIAVRFLTRYFTTRSLTPFAVYCLVAGAVSTVWFAAR
jgi:undecaprenyl-diphosphatase